MRKYILLLLAMIACCAACAQTSTNVYDRTPNAGNIAKIANIPVSGATGQANITIPIYSTNQNGVPLDVTLSYDTSGYLLNSLPGWLGHGWTLNAGGCITRVMNTQCDEFISTNIASYYGNYFTNHGRILEGVTFPTISIRPNENTETENAELAEFFDSLRQKSTECDLEPDIFYFNFLGHSGRFFLGNDGEWKVLSDSNIDVILDITSTQNNRYTNNDFFGEPILNRDYNFRTIKKIILVDDNGNRYTFGDNANAIEYTNSLQGCGMFREPDRCWTANAWYLSNVVDRFGNCLYSFEYQRGKYIIQMQNTGMSSGFHYCGSVQSPVYLSAINTREGEQINFHASADPLLATRYIYPDFYASGNANAAKWQGFSTCSNIGDICRLELTDLFKSENIGVLASSSTNTNDPLSPMEMCTLDSITILSDINSPFSTFAFIYDHAGKVHLSSINHNSGTHLLNTYSFDYYNYGAIPTSYLTLDKDDWGYYKPHTHGSTPGGPGDFHPSDPYVPRLLSTNNTPYYKCGMLQSITYPTGGKRTIDYDKHDSNLYLDESRTYMEIYTGEVGGVRVKSIVDEMNDTIVASYTYHYKMPSFNSNDEGYGLSSTSSGQLFTVPEYLRQLYAGNSRISAYNWDFAKPLSDTFGSHVGYSYMTEVRLDGSYTTYQFSNISEAKESLSPLLSPLEANSLSKFCEHGYKRGKLLSEAVYDTNGNLCSHSEYIYEPDVHRYNSNHFVYASNYNGWLDDSMGRNGCVYKMYYPKYNLQKVVNTVYCGSDSLVTEKQFSYKDYEVNTLLENGRQLAAFRKLDEERTTRGTDVHSTRYAWFMADSSKFFIPACSKTEYLNGELIKKDSVVFARVNFYYQPTAELVFRGNSAGLTSITYDEYDSFGKLLAFTEAGKCQTKLSWAINNKLQAVVTSPYNNIVFNTLSNGEVVCKYNNVNIFEMPLVEASLYKYNRNGLVEKSISRNNEAHYYLYDTNGRLRQINNTNGYAISKYTYHYNTGE